MATVRMRKSGWWQAIIDRKGYPMQSKTFEFKEDAQKWARDIESQIDKGIFSDRSEAERMTLHDLIERFKKEFAPNHYRQREDGKEAYKSQCKRLDDRLGMYSLALLDQKLVTKYRDDRLTDAAGSTVRKEIFMLSKILGFGEIECGITLPRGNPTKKIRKPSEGKGRERRLSNEDLEKLLKECEASRNKYLLPCVELAIETAMRQGEILALTWNDVDLIEGLIFVRKSKGDTSEEQGRIVPLTDRAIAILTTLPRGIKNMHVFPVQRMTLYHVYMAAVKRAQISDFDFHDLRHEALSRLGETGDLSTREMMQMSGHKTARMVMKYQHADIRMIREKLKTKPTAMLIVTEANA
jgi:integrase